MPTMVLLVVFIIAMIPAFFLSSSPQAYAITESVVVLVLVVLRLAEKKQHRNLGVYRRRLGVLAAFWMLLIVNTIMNFFVMCTADIGVQQFMALGLILGSIVAALTLSYLQMYRMDKDRKKGCDTPGQSDAT